MTGLPARLALAMSCFCDDGDLLDRHFHAEIAARDHDAVGRVRESRRSARARRQRSIFAMMKGCLPMAFAAARTASMSAAVSTNDWLTASTPCSEREFQARAVVVGERADAEIDARQIEALPGTQFAADRDRALDVVARHALDDELHQAVVEEEPVARLHDARQRIEAHRDPAAALPTMSSLVSVKLSPGTQLDRLRLDLADAHLRTRQVGHDGDAPAGGPFAPRGCARCARRGRRSPRARS